MASKIGSKIFILVSILILSTLYGQASAGRDAYSGDLAACLFNSWATAGATKVLTSAASVTCVPSNNQIPLCYSVSGSGAAAFISCYNNQSLIPDYTAHVATKVTGKPGRPGCGDWYDDKGSLAPQPASTVKGTTSDYSKASQGGLYPNYGTGNNSFCSRGHYVPCGDFNTLDQRKLTFINTNVAPQWQLFNGGGGNWAQLEAAIRAYVASSKAGKLYVFTGTGGQAQNNGAGITLSGKVVAPLYYWKAVCDPGVGSIVFVAVNNIGDISTSQVTSGCNKIPQTSKYGIINCFSLEGAKAAYTHLLLPAFDPTNCKTTVQGTFMNSLLNGNGETKLH